MFLARAGTGGKSKAAKSELHVENHWQTPDWILEIVRQMLGGIDLDPCTTVENPCGAERIYTPADDGILMPWNADRIYVNPPYGYTIRHWVQKCVDSGKGGSRVVMLAPARPDALWFQFAWQNADDALFFKKRLTFKGGQWPAPFASVLFAFGLTIPGELTAHGYKAMVTAA